MPRNVEQDLIDAVMPGRRRADREKMIELWNELGRPVVNTLVIVTVGWLSWNFMPINRDRQLSFQDAIGGAAFISSVAMLVRRS